MSLLARFTKENQSWRVAEVMKMDFIQERLQYGRKKDLSVELGQTLNTTKTNTDWLPRAKWRVNV